MGIWRRSGRIAMYIALLGVMLTVSLAPQEEAYADFSSGTLAEIKMFGGNFAPRGWSLCDGQLISISQYQALFSLLGTIYGGDGRTTFALPDMRGRSPIHAGDGPGLTDRRLGSKSGTEATFLSVAQMPSHNHTATTSNGVTATLFGSPTAEAPTIMSKDPLGRALGRSRQKIYSSLVPSAAMHANSLSVSVASTTTVLNNGGSQSHDNMHPFLTVNFVIAMTGTFPSRN